MRRILFVLASLLCSVQAAAFEISGASWLYPSANFVVSFSGNSPSGESWNSAFERALAAWTSSSTFEFNSNDGLRDPCSGRNTSAFGDGITSGSTNSDRFHIRGAKLSRAHPFNQRLYGETTHNSRPNFLWADSHVSDMSPSEMDITAGQPDYRSLTK